MNNASPREQKAFVLYLSGVGISDIRGLAEVEKLMKRGVIVELESTPITSPQAQYYQLFSGQLPASFGFFDTLMPACHLSRVKQGANTYTIEEENKGRDETLKMFDERLRTAGWLVDYEEVALSELASYVQALTSSLATEANCKIVRSVVDQGERIRAQSDTSMSIGWAIEESLRLARTWVGENGLLVLLSDSSSAPVQRYVNVNDFFVEVGLIERDEETGLINWSNSLAYYAGHGQLWVNLLGRDPQGSVHPYEYEEVRNTLIEALPAKLRDSETGIMVVERIYRKEELYTGDYLFCAPDLVVLFRPGYAPSPSSLQLGFDDTTFTIPPKGTVVRAGVHPSSIKGFLLASSPELISGISLPGSVPLTWATPTIMHALGVACDDIDGAAIDNFFLPSYLETHPIRTATKSGELSVEDEELVINRLRDLGYI